MPSAPITMKLKCNMLLHLLYRLATPSAAPDQEHAAKSCSSIFRRIKDLENLALTYPGVEKAYAIQAGRELRVIVESDRVTDGDSDKLSFEIAQKIQTEMTYPGTNQGYRNT